jgi:hypothetical protein
MAAVSVYIKREGRLMESEQVVRCRDRNAALEAENAVLWAYYGASEAWNDWEDEDTLDALNQALGAVRQYEEKS